MRRAFTLIEVNLAMLIMAGGILSIVGLYAFGFRENRQSREDVAATALADSVISPLVMAISATNLKWSVFRQEKNFPDDKGWKQSSVKTVYESPADSAYQCRHDEHEIETPYMDERIDKCGYYESRVLSPECLHLFLHIPTPKQFFCRPYDKQQGNGNVYLRCRAFHSIYGVHLWAGKVEHPLRHLVTDIEYHPHEGCYGYTDEELRDERSEGSESLRV